MATPTSAGTGPVATVGELIERLSKLPAGMRVLVDGYEGGFSGVASTTLVEVQELAGMPDYMGRFATLEDAAREMDSGGESGWQFSIDGQPPTAVGVPVTALWLRRE